MRLHYLCQLVGDWHNSYIFDQAHQHIAKAFAVHCGRCRVFDRGPDYLAVAQSHRRELLVSGVASRVVRDVSQTEKRYCLGYFSWPCLGLRRHLVVNKAVTNMPVIAPEMTAEIVCASSITRAYMVSNIIGITITPNQRL